MTGCIVCGDPTPHRRCRDCARAERQGQAVNEREWAECPNCGGPTSGEGITCANCRRSGGDRA